MNNIKWIFPNQYFTYVYPDTSNKTERMTAHIQIKRLLYNVYAYYIHFKFHCTKACLMILCLTYVVIQPWYHIILYTSNITSIMIPNETIKVYLNNISLTDWHDHTTTHITKSANATDSHFLTLTTQHKLHFLLSNTSSNHHFLLLRNILKTWLSF